LIRDRSRAKVSIDVLFYAEPDVPRRFIGDPLRLSQIFVNLTNNAIKFTDRGEVIICIAIAPAGDAETATLVFSITDSGIGMTSEQMAHLFQAFNQADSSISRRFGGTGLGLSISYRLAQLMGGNIMAESEHGQGSRFHCTVQLHYKNQHREPWVAIPAHLQSLKVMIIDDRAVTRSVIAEMVQSMRWSAVAVDNSTASLSMFADPILVPFDLLLLMTRLADTSYRDTIDAIEAALPAAHRPKIIVISNNIDPAFSNQFEANNTINVLIKPFTPLNLLDTVAALFSETAHHQVHQQALSGQQPFSGAHILIVEDNEFNQLLITELLTSWDIKVSLAQNGVECLDLLKAAGSSFDLIFMDIQMPKMDGLEATRRIRQDLHLNGIPIVALTANIMEHDQQEFLAAGMNAYLPKPFDPNQLIQVLDQFLQPGGKKTPT
jgi:CheY-like chemotaxis protein